MSPFSLNFQFSNTHSPQWERHEFYTIEKQEQWPRRGGQTMFRGFPFIGIAVSVEIGYGIGICLFAHIWLYQVETFEF